MKKKKFIKKLINHLKEKAVFYLTVVVILTTLWLMGNIQYKCFEEETICYKTECNFWGCNEFEVDMDSQQCERKTTKCTMGTYS